ncbi:Uncharacterised protein [Enterobacter cloacae]|nr:Uncharacterised protein [Enterobacter cloacae]
MPPLRGFTRRQLVAHRTRARQVGNRSRRDLKDLHAAVQLFHPYVERARDGIIQFLNAKRPGGHLRFVYHASLLADGHFAARTGDARHFGCVATQARRQHTEIGIQANAAKAEGIEDIGAEVIFPHRQLRFQ